MPSFALPTQASTTEALMALDIESPHRALHRIDDREDDDGFDQDVFGTADGRAGTPTPRIRSKPSNIRPKSYHQILENFQGVEQRLSNSPESHPTLAESAGSYFDTTDNSQTGASSIMTESQSLTGSPPSRARFDRQLSTPQRKEDTARRHKRFSLPAVALQTTPVTARTGEGRSKRYSLVLGNNRQGSRQGPSDIHNESVVDVGGVGQDGLSHGVAAGKLSELLSRG